MTLVLAVVAGLLGMVAVAAGCIAVFVAGSGRKAVDAALADESADGLRARGVLLVERIRSPALRWVINRRTGAMAGTVVVGVVRDRLDALRRGGLIGLASGVALVILAVMLPGLMR